jgi:hypothetical protein
MDATPRYIRVPEVPHRIKGFYGDVLSRSLKFVLITRNPEERAWSWFRFFALNAVDGKSWAQDQLEKEYWFHWNHGTFRKWTIAELERKAACKRRGVANNQMWPNCDSETGMFAGFFASQLRHWFAVFDPGQFIIVPMECYVRKGPVASLTMIGEASGLSYGKSIGDVDKRFHHSNEKHLKRIVGSKDGTKAGSANRHGEIPIPLGGAKYLKEFFKHEGHAMASLLKEFPAVRVLDCGMTHFFKPCNSSGCLPTYDAAMAVIDRAINDLQKNESSSLADASSF